uniref:NRDE family protein n=1 Tax=Flavobacterium sp. TaxID=239 RepID=UPI00404A4C8A
MCTVSFVYSNNQIIITSNRDEKVVRETAIKPKSYFINNKNIIFPKDPKAGGTWFAVDENSNVVVLLNGAEEKHLPKSNYRKSRGLIVLDIISSQSPIEAWKSIDLEAIEPFTMVLFQDNDLYQLRWNEFEKSTKLLHNNQPHIWSSATLYSNEIRKQRATWFADFLRYNSNPDAHDLMDFHRNTKPENQDFGLVINRNDALKTVSITQVVMNQNKATIFYDDLIQENTFSNSFISL